MAKKILKVKVGRKAINGGTRYVYPPVYDASKIQVLVYESSLEENLQEVKNRGNNYEFLLGLVDEADAPRFLKSEDITEISRSEAEQLGAVWTKQQEKITDQNAVLSVLSKMARKETLSTDDQKVIDPNDDTPGIAKSKSFSQILDESGV